MNYLLKPFLITKQFAIVVHTDMSINVKRVFNSSSQIAIQLSEQGCVCASCTSDPLVPKITLYNFAQIKITWSVHANSCLVVM